MIVHQHNKSRLDKAAFIMLAHLQSLGAVLYFQKLTLFIAVEPAQLKFRVGEIILVQ